MTLPYEPPKMRVFLNTETGYGYETDHQGDPPSGYIEVFPGGQVFSRAEYPKLYELLAKYSENATDTEFKLPDFQPRTTLRTVDE